MKIAYLTAGAGGMFCGSCLRDNALAAALARLGADIELIPTYTPIKTDEPDVSNGKVFYGGINVFLQEKIPLFRWLPRFMDRFLDSPRIIRWATSKGMETDGHMLGKLTVSMLRGTAGRQRKEAKRLVKYLSGSAKPQIVNLSNMLIAGCVPAIKKSLGVPVLVTLQGDDIFLNDVLEPYRSQAFEEIRKIVEQVDGFIVFSQYYADEMSRYFGIPKEKFHLVPLGLDTRDFAAEQPLPETNRPPTIGYLARLAPEKGLHLLVDAFIHLRQQPGMEEARLHIAGWLGGQHQKYADEQFARLRGAGLENAFHYHGTVDRKAKLEFLRGIDVLSVPTTYRDPKGLFVLEALAAGVPVVQPAHGAFPELLAATGGGKLFEPNNHRQLSHTLRELLLDSDARRRLGQAARQTVLRDFDSLLTARQTLEIYRRFLPR